MVRITTSTTDLLTCNIDEVIEIMEACVGSPGEDIWLLANGGHPCLAAIVSGHLAVLHFFLNDNGDMYQSIGRHTEDIELQVNGEIMLMSSDAIIPVDKALDAARQFCNTFERPTCIDWRDL